jgi:hypothetical protein
MTSFSRSWRYCSEVGLSSRGTGGTSTVSCSTTHTPDGARSEGASGGYPYFRPKLPGVETAPLPAEHRFLVLPSSEGVPAARILDGPNPYVRGHEPRYGPNGYVVLNIDGPTLTEEIYAPDGTVLHTSSLA